jgi:cytochrome c553
MISLLLPFFLLVLGQGAPAPAASVQPAGDAKAGKDLWQGNTTSCKNCHGVDAEGGFGPALAGRRYTVDQLIDTVREPRAPMPAFIDSQVSEKDAADFAEYFASLPVPEKTAPWRFTLPPNAPRGQVIAVQNIGCGMCHNPELETPRHSTGAVNGDFEWFKHQVYEHQIAAKEFWKQIGSKGTPRVRMGNYSRTNLPEPVLKEIYDWIKDLGFLAPVTAAFSQGEATANGVTYTLNLIHLGQKGKGLPAENATIRLTLPAGAQVVGTTGEGYQGVQHAETTKADEAVWLVPHINAGDRLTYTITLAKAGTEKDNVRGTVRWTTNPAPKTAEMLNVRVGTRPREIP